MPAKTIYVSEDDLSLLKQAQQKFGGNLSAAIIASLKRVLEIEDRERGLETFEVFEVKVGKVAYSKKRFTGTLLAKGLVPGDHAQARPSVTYSAFKSKGGKFLLHTHVIPSLTQAILLSLGPYDLGEGEYRLEIMEDVQEMEEKVPPEFFKVVTDKLDNIHLEFLDL